MTGPALPPDILDRMRSLETQVKDLQRSQNGVVPTLFDLPDVSGQPARSGVVLEYDRATGRWLPGEVMSPGDIKWSASVNLPPGRWLAADASAVSRTTYADLFGEIGTTYGIGNGSTTFNLPGLSGKFIIGVGTDALAATGGSRNAVAVAHTHTTGHAATAAEASGLGLTVSTTFQDRVRVNRATGVGTGDVTDPTGASATNANLPPFLALYGYIRY